jgi:hypothetical protein
MTTQFSFFQTFILVVNCTHQSQQKARTLPNVLRISIQNLVLPLHCSFLFSRTNVSELPSQIGKGPYLSFLCCRQFIPASALPPNSLDIPHNKYLGCTDPSPQPRLHFSSSTSVLAIPHPRLDILPSHHLIILPSRIYQLVIFSPTTRFS